MEGHRRPADAPPTTSATPATSTARPETCSSRRTTPGTGSGRYRDTQDPAYASFLEAIEQQRSVTIEVLYTDHEGRQPTMTRFNLVPKDGSPNWLCTVIRHRLVDGADPH